MNMTADQFMRALAEKLSPLVRDERTTFITLHPSMGPVVGRKSSYITVTFINLPTPRAKERRGGGAENENNRMLFFVRDFNGPPFTLEPVEKVKVELLVNNIVPRGDSYFNLRKKTASPDKIATYLAEYVNQVALNYQPNYTHE